MKWRMFQPESYKRGGVTSTGLQVASQGLAFLFNMVMAACFGAIVATDVFNYCVTTFTMVAGFMLSLDTAVLIPEAMRRRAQVSEESSMAFLNFFLYLFCGVAVVVSLVALWRPIGFLTAISQFDASSLEANRVVILWTIPVFALQILGQYMNSVLVSYKYFSLPAVWGVFFRVLNLVYVLAFHRVLGVVALAQSLIIGQVVQNGVSLWLMKRQLGWRFGWRRPRIGWGVWRNVLYTEVGVVVVTLSVFSPVLMGSAGGEGFVTAMNYALKVESIPEALLCVQVALIAGIKLNELSARRDWAGFDAFYQRMTRFLLWSCTPLAFGLCVTAPDLLRLLLRHGAYTEEALGVTVTLFQAMVLVLPGLLYNAMFLQTLVARQQVLHRAVLDMAMCLVIFAGLWLVVPRVGLLRYPWVRTVCIYVISGLWMAGTWRMELRVRLGGVYGRMLLNLAVNAGIAAVCWAVAQMVPGWTPAVRLVAVTGVYVALWLGMQEVWKWDRLAWNYGWELAGAGWGKPRLLVVPGADFEQGYSGTKHLLDALSRRFRVVVWLFTFTERREFYRRLEYPCRILPLRGMGRDKGVWVRVQSKLFRVWVFLRALVARRVLVTEGAYLREVAWAKWVKGGRLRLGQFCQEFHTVEEYSLGRWPTTLKRYARVVDVMVDVNPQRALAWEGYYGLQARPFVLRNTFPLADCPERSAKGELWRLAGIEAPATGIPVVLYGGGVGKEKPFERVIDAVAQLGRPCFLLAFCAAERDRIEELRTYAAVRLVAGSYHLRGVVGRDALMASLWEADVGVVNFPYSEEPTVNQKYCEPTKLYEYMAAGVAVLGFDSEPLREIVEMEEIGRCARGETPADLATALRVVLDGDLAGMKARARAAFETTYCYERLCATEVEKIAVALGAEKKEA